MTTNRTHLRRALLALDAIASDDGAHFELRPLVDDGIEVSFVDEEKAMAWMSRIEDVCNAFGFELGEREGAFFPEA